MGRRQSTLGHPPDFGAPLKQGPALLSVWGAQVLSFAETVASIHQSLSGAPWIAREMFEWRVSKQFYGALNQSFASDLRR